MASGTSRIANLILAFYSFSHTTFIRAKTDFKVWKTKVWKTVPLQSKYSFWAIRLMHDCEFAATKWRKAHRSISFYLSS